MIKKIRKHHEFMSDYAVKLIRTFLRPATLFLGFLAIGVLFIGSTLFYLFEQGLNQSINSFFDALYYGVTLMTSVGLGDISPLTVPGKIVSMFLMIAGTGIFVAFTAVLATSLIEIESDHLKK